MDEINITCPITKQIFSNPVIADDGNIYEKDAIIKWLEFKSISPITRSRMSDKLTSVNLLKTIIEDFIKNDAQLKEKQYIAIKEFSKHRSEIYKFIKEKQFDELLNYHYYDCCNLIHNGITVNIHNSDKYMNYLHLLFIYCQDENVITHIIDNDTLDNIKLLTLLCAYSSESLIMKYIDKFPRNFDFVSNRSWNPLHFFAKRGFKNAIKLIFKKNIAMNLTKLTERDYTPLMMAIQFKQHKIIKILINQMATLNIKLKNKDITFAIKKSVPFQLIKYMIDNCKLNNRILYHIFNSKKYNGTNDVVKYLIKFGVGLGYKDSNNYNVLHSACKSSSNEIIIMLAQKKPLLINKKDKSKGHTPWMVALNYDKYNAFINMTKYIDHTIKTNLKSSLIHILADCGNYNTFKCMMDKYDLDINTKNEKGMTPLHFALTIACPKISEMIINRGGDVNCANNKGKYPIHYALQYQYKYPHLIKLLFTKIDNFEIPYKNNFPIHYAAKWCDVEIIRLLIDKNVDLEVKGNDNEKPIHLVCEHNNNDDLIKYMIDVKHVDIESGDKCGFRPIQYICWKGSIDLIKYIINKTDNHSTYIKFTDAEKCRNLLQVLMMNKTFKDEINTMFNISTLKK